jgi:hypothetical protein
VATAIDAASAPRPAADGTPDSRTAAMRRHDGLAHVLGQLVAADGLLPSTHGSPYRLVVTVPHTTLTTALTQHDQTRPGHPRHGETQPGVAKAPTSAAPSSDRSSEAGALELMELDPMELESVGVGPVVPGLLPDGFPLSPLAVQAMACAADLVPVLVDADHQPLDVGDTQYAFPAKIRTAIITRDRGCTYPGCGAPAPWCDTHHLTPFSQGGATSINNGALLCGRHHRYVHALGLTGRVITRDGVSRVAWDHRPTSWTATTATTATATTTVNVTATTGSGVRSHEEQETAGESDTGQRDDEPGTPGGNARPGAHTCPATDIPVLTDRCLDHLIHRWLRRQHQARQRDQAA